MFGTRLDIKMINREIDQKCPEITPSDKLRNLQISSKNNEKTDKILKLVALNKC